MANINTHKKELVEAMENYEEARVALNNAAKEANKAWAAYLEAKNKRDK